MIGTQKGSSISKSKDDWHLFEINWEQDRIQFAVDTQIYFEFPRGGSVDEWPFDQRFHIILNVAVGGTWGGAQGIDIKSFLGIGQIMELDWVRVYANSSQSQPTNQPTVPPSKNPTSQPTYCGCNTCTQAVWDTIATDAGGSYSCGARITWLQSNQSYSEASACEKVDSEFPTICLCSCAMQVPTAYPTHKPSSLPTNAPTNTPTQIPTGRPTSVPSRAPTTSRPSTLKPTTARPSSKNPTPPPTPKPKTKKG